MLKTLMTQPPAPGLSGYVAASHSAFTAPGAAAQGTGLSFAGLSTAVLAAAFAGAAAEVAAVVTAGVRNTDLPGSPPRGAPV